MAHGYFSAEASVHDFAEADGTSGVIDVLRIVTSSIKWCEVKFHLDGLVMIVFQHSHDADTGTAVDAALFLPPVTYKVLNDVH